MECLYVNFDFDGAQKKLRECETVRFITFIRLVPQSKGVSNSQGGPANLFEVVFDSVASVFSEL